jgi:hypothetical protein
MLPLRQRIYATPCNVLLQGYRVFPTVRRHYSGFKQQTPLGERDRAAIGVIRVFYVLHQSLIHQDARYLHQRLLPFSLRLASDSTSISGMKKHNSSSNVVRSVNDSTRLRLIFGQKKKWSRDKSDAHRSGGPLS